MPKYSRIINFGKVAFGPIFNMAKREDNGDLMNPLLGEIEGRLPSASQREGMGHAKKARETLNSLGFIKEYEEDKREEDLQLVSTVEKQVQGVLGEVQYIAELLATQKKYKEEGIEVENLNAKIKKAMEKIKAYMNPKEGQELTSDAVNRRTAGGPSVEQNPLIKEMGGMPLETISAEWEVVGEMLDKAELENEVKKLKDRVTKANELKNKHKLTNKPTAKPGQQMTPKFQKLQQTVKYILKQMPKPEAPAPTPAPKPTIAPPRPY